MKAAGGRLPAVQTEHEDALRLFMPQDIAGRFKVRRLASKPTPGKRLAGMRGFRATARM